MDHRCNAGRRDCVDVERISPDAKTWMVPAWEHWPKFASYRARLWPRFFGRSARGSNFGCELQRLGHERLRHTHRTQWSNCRRHLPDVQNSNAGCWPECHLVLLHIREVELPTICALGRTTGSDLLSTGNGDDWLIGVAGNETLVGGNGDDRFVFTPGAG